MPGWDVHTHLVPEALAGERRFPDPRIFDPAALVAWLDERGLDGALVSAPPPLFGYDLPPARAAAWARRVNDGLEELVAAAPDRLRALAHLPLPAPEAAAEEARRRTGEPWAGVSLGTSVPPAPCSAADEARARSNGALKRGTLADPALDPLWAALDERGAFALVHPVDAPDPRLDAFYLRNLLGNPYETSFAAACLIFADVPARFGSIRFCLSHAGGATAALAGRWQRGYDTDRPGIPRLELEPAAAARRLWVDSVAHSEPALALAREVFGEDHVLTGSDWPFPMGAA